MLTNEYLKQVYADVVKRNAGEPEFHQAVLEVLESLELGEPSCVTSIAGTTRDTLEETVEAGGITLRLADTAGLRDASDEVEQVGIERARGKMQEAELVIFVCDGSRPMEADEAELVKEIKDLSAAKIAVVNKIDKGETVASLDESAFDVTVTLSAKTGEGVEKLHDAIAKLWGSEKISLTDDAVIWNARQRASLSTAYELLSDAAAALKLGAPPDAACTMAESALSALRNEHIFRLHG